MYIKDFTSKAYIRIIDDFKRNHLVELLEQMGYDNIYGGSFGDNIIIINCGELSVDYTTPYTNDYIDCIKYANGDVDFGILLFFELANMMGEGTDRGQWFTDGVNGFHKCISRKMSNDLLYEVNGDFNDELAEAISSGEIAKDELCYFIWMSK